MAVNDSPGQCIGKQAHETGAHARKVVENMRRFGKTVQAYRCPLCEFWHVGRRHGPKRRPKGKRRG